MTTARKKLSCNIGSKTSTDNKLIIMDSAHSVCVQEELPVSVVPNLASPDVDEDAVTCSSDPVATPSGHPPSVNKFALPKLSAVCVDASTEKDMVPFVSPPSSPRSRPKRVTDAPKKKRNNDVERCRRNLSNDVDFRKDWMKRMARHFSSESAVGAC
jgi:hypothetical protein